MLDKLCLEGRRHSLSGAGRHCPPSPPSCTWPQPPPCSHPAPETAMGLLAQTLPRLQRTLKTGGLGVKTKKKTRQCLLLLQINSLPHM